MLFINIALENGARGASFLTAAGVVSAYRPGYLFPRTDIGIGLHRATRSAADVLLCRKIRCAKRPQRIAQAEMDKKQGMVAVTNPPLASPEPLDLLDDVLSKAKAAGAEAADAIFADSRALSVAYRLGKQESLERSEAKVVGLRVFVGQRQAIVSSSAISSHALAALVERGMAMVRAVPEDPYCGLADPSEIARETIDVDACEPREIDVATVSERAMAAEAAALSVAGVTNSEGAEAGAGLDIYAIAGSNGLRRTYSRSWHNVSVSVLAGEGTEMERDYDYASSVYLEDLEDPERLGRRCGERAVLRLHPRKASSAQVPIVYEPRVARSLLGHLAAAINGSAVARGTTFLNGKLGEHIFAQSVSIIDDPLRRRGLRSRPFDGEGIPSSRRAIVENGVLKSWLLDLRAARQLGLRSTAHAARGASSPPSPAPTNLYLEPGNSSAEQLVRAIPSGLYLTDLMGFGINGVTGDYSRGASGFWIENGELAYPVSEITVSGNLLQMFQELTPASDLEFRYGVDSPTLRLDGMTVAGR
jgi:PmbA protein